MAKAKDFDRIAAYIRGQTPQPGMFSTMDELLRVAPRPEMGAQELREYLQPGRMLEADGVQFPLKKSEIEATRLDELLNDLGALHDKINVEELRSLITSDRPSFELTRAGGDYPIGETGMEQILESPYSGRLIREDANFRDYNLHHSSPGSGYEESVTRLKDLSAKNPHFDPDTLSWGRATTHTMPETGKKMRLVEEIQADVHQSAREWEKQTGERSYLPPSERQLLPELRESIGEFTDAEGNPYPDLDELELDSLARDRHQLESLEARDKAPPFADPKEYARVELSKQLLDAIDEGDDYLALVRGQDQIDRYEVGMDETSSKGMRHMYDVIYPSVLKKLANRYGARIVDVESPLQSQRDIRGEVMAEYGAENWQDMAGMTSDALGSFDIVEWEETPQLYEGILSEWEDELFPTNLPWGEPVREARRLIKQLAVDINDVLYSDGSWKESDAAVERRMRNTLEDMDSNVVSALQQIDMAMEDIEHMVKQTYGDTRTGTKTFPAIEITPEVREKIKRVGVPLFSATGALILPEEDEEPEVYAKGGKVGKVLDAAHLFSKKEPDMEELRQFHREMRAKIDEGVRADKERVSQMSYQYSPGDVVRTKMYRYEILGKSFDKKTGEPLYYVRNLENGAEHRITEEGIVGKFDGPQKKAEGGSVDKEPRSILKATAMSLAGAIPFIEDDTRKYIGDTIAHIPSGMMSQTHGINPETGEVEFGLFNPARFIPLEEREANQRLQDIYERETTRTRAIPGIIDETMALPLLGEMVGIGTAPDWAHTAGDRTEATRAAIRGEMGLEDPEGFFQHLADAGGMMMGQLPVPLASMRSKAEPVRGALQRAGNVLGATPRAGLEFLSPIIEPKVGNYVAGALFGGTLGSAFEEGEVPPDIQALVERAEQGDEEAYATLLELYEEYKRKEKRQGSLADAMRIMGSRASMAGGGRVLSMAKLMKKRRPQLEDEAQAIYERLRALERNLEKEGLTRAEIRKILTPKNEEFAGGGKVDMTRRAFLKGLGAAGVAAGAGKVALREGVMSNPDDKLAMIEKALDVAPSAAKGAAKSTFDTSSFRKVIDYLRQDLDDARADSDDLATDMAEMLEEDMANYQGVLQALEEGDGPRAAELYDNMDTAARELIYDSLEGDELLTARSILSQIGSDYESIPLQLHPEYDRIVQEAKDAKSLDDYEMLDDLRHQLEHEGYDDMDLVKIFKRAKSQPARRKIPK